MLFDMTVFIIESNAKQKLYEQLDKHGSFDGPPSRLVRLEPIKSQQNQR